MVKGLEAHWSASANACGFHQGVPPVLSKLPTKIELVARQVAKVRRSLEDRSLEIATAAGARERLGLKGGDRVGF